MMQMDKIIVVHRRAFQQRPPVISVVKYMTELGYTPHVITTDVNEHYKDVFKKKGINYSVIPFQITKNFILNALKGFIWGIKARREIKRLAKLNQNIVLWVEGNYTFESLTARFINKYRHILQHQELFDPLILKGRMTIFTLKKIMPTAIANLAPEYNRTQIYRAMLQLKQLPFLLPNKPAFVPSVEELAQFRVKYKDIVECISGRKLILYQGVLSGERNLDVFVKAIASLPKDKYVLMFLGKKSSKIDYYKSLNPELIHVNYIPAPDYLFITSLAHIGIVTYLPVELDLIYCAPNKIFEYGAFGIPMLGNEIPGLKYSVELAGCGLTCDDSSEVSILEAIEHIESHYTEMSKKARAFFDSIDNKSTIQKVLQLI